MNQLKMPLYDRLILHQKGKPISLHVPGHKNGYILPVRNMDLFKEILKIDVTELTGLDDLHSPEGVILESEQLLSELYDVKKSFLLVNGTTVGNIAMILAALDDGDEVLVQRNSHKSILNGLQLANAVPVFLNPEYERDWKVAGGITYETVQAALKKYPKTKAIIITYPSYYGMVNELDKIIKLAHSHQIPVMVDEAHGAHFIAGTPFPPSAVSLGADIVVQSAHKTLPAMTMGSFLHFNSQFISLDQIQKYLNILQSSSPSYPIMASLDIARSYLGTIDYQDIHYLVKEIDTFRNQISNIEGLKVLTYPNNKGDLLKITIQAKGSVSGFELQKRLEEQGVFAELADPHNVLFIVPLLKSEMDYPFGDIVDRIAAAMEGLPLTDNEEDEIPIYNKSFSKLALSFKEMRKREVKLTPLDESAGKIVAEMITPYPPGIPLLFPGEIITAEDIQQIRWLNQKGTRFQGGNFLKDGVIQTY